jgi:LDH2 family malate/lactate/ureidoglycolate dehydrogenase
MSTCTAAYGKIEIAKRTGEPIPTGWAINQVGEDTTDPGAMIEGGALLPLGSTREQGGHKGYALAVAVDMLCGVLSGANWGPFCPPFALRQEIPARSVGKGIGHFFGAMDVEGFIDLNEFRHQTAELIATLRATRPAPGTSGPLIPGDPEREAYTERMRNGIPLVAKVVQDLEDVAKRRGVKMPS